MADNNFYKAFEDKFRGSQDSIKQRLQVYKPFLDILAQLDNKRAIDLGCGRGEWLDILSDNDFDALGIDLDLGMLKACQERGLRVKHQDAIEALQQLEDVSVAIVSGFHIAEHLPFDSLQILIQEALRVLKPGGILILETPNPENIKVATENFYLDPTHIRPLPSQLLSFLPEYYGFERTKVLRLQEDKKLHSIHLVSLSNVIHSASPDYAVIAQKSATAVVFHKFDELFEKEFGLSLDSLLHKFEYRIASIEHNANEANIRATQAEHSANEANIKAAQAEHSANEANIKAAQAEHSANEAWHHYSSIASSNSWKLTYPLRLTGKAMRWFIAGIYHWITFSPTSRPRRVIKNLALKMKNYIVARPKLKYKLINILNKFPTLKARLRRVGTTGQSHHIIQNSKLKIQNLELSHLSPQAKQIYLQLKDAIEQRKNEVQK